MAGASGLLASVLGGAASGAGETMQKNVAQANDLIEREALVQQAAQVQDQYAQAAENRAFTRAATMRTAVMATLSSQLPQELAARGLVYSQDELTPAMEKAGMRVATVSEAQQAKASVLLSNGFDTDKAMELAGKYGQGDDKLAGVVLGRQIQAESAQTVQGMKGATALGVAGINAGGQANRGVAAASVYGQAQRDVATTNAGGKIGAAIVGANPGTSAQFVPQAGGLLTSPGTPGVAPLPPGFSATQVQ